jgi:Flp pilus assembly protein TadG
MSLSPFIAILLPALLVMIGLVIDGGAQAAAARRAESVAAAAARAAADDSAAAKLAGAKPNIAHAIAVAHSAIAAAGIAGEVQVVAGRVVVHTKATVATSLLSLIGITKLTASGSAEAELVADR